MSTRITKIAADKVALILTTKKQKQVTDAKVAVNEYITKLYEATIPKVIIDGFAKFPDFFKKSGILYIGGTGIQRWESVNITKSLPNPDKTFELKQEQAEKFIKLKREHEKQTTEYEKLKLDVETAVFNARTYKRIAELFPEAVPHLPAVFPPPAINYSDIRKRIK